MLANKAPLACCEVQAQASQHRGRAGLRLGCLPSPSQDAIAYARLYNRKPVQPLMYRLGVSLQYHYHQRKRVLRIFLDISLCNAIVDSLDQVSIHCDVLHDNIRMTVELSGQLQNRLSSDWAVRSAAPFRRWIIHLVRPLGLLSKHHFEQIVKCHIF